MQQIKLPLLHDDEPPFEEISLEDVADVLSLTIKDDDVNKKTIFLAMLSAYTDKSQINVSINAPSSTGKTYLASQISALFPEEDKVKRSGASPTSFFYGEGIVDEERNAKIVSLSRKILLFFEQPNPELQMRLRGLLSHDDREIIHTLTNKTKGRNQTDKIILQGFPATVFCSAGMRLDEQEATRAILISPEATQAKINQAVSLQFERGADEGAFRARIESNPARNELKRRIIAIRDEHVDDIIIPSPDELERRFRALLPVLQPRHSRDSDHFQQLIKAIALLNVWHRRQSDGTIIASQSDIEQAFILWEDFFDTQNLNVPPAVLAIYKKYVLPAYIEKYSRADRSIKAKMVKDEVGLSVQELNAFHLDAEGAPMNNDLLRKQILPQLESSGLLVLEKPVEGDKRSRHIFPKRLTDDIKNKVGRRGMGDIGDKVGDGW